MYQEIREVDRLVMVQSEWMGKGRASGFMKEIIIEVGPGMCRAVQKFPK